MSRSSQFWRADKDTSHSTDSRGCLNSNRTGHAPARSATQVRSSEQEHPILAKVSRLKLFGKSPVGFFLRLNRWAWQRLPSGVRDFYPVRAYGGWLHRLVCVHETRQQSVSTFFLRNRSALELIRRRAEDMARGSTLRIAVLACSLGAEVYSILWTIRSARPDLKVHVWAVDASREMLNFAEKGTYAPNTSELVGSSIFERLTPNEMEEMFDWDGDQARVKPWLREGIEWRLGDASDPELIRALGPQDMVTANNFLCHMEPRAAAHCLRNITSLVDRGGYLFVSGVDLEVREKVARERGWRPVTELIEQIHEGDPSARNGWPLAWWGLEPIDHRRRDWQIRYAAAYRLNDGD
jgi:chemotaxis methyl-accepting protein methylase